MYYFLFCNKKNRIGAMLCDWADKIPILGSAREEILETIFLPSVQNLF